MEKLRESQEAYTEATKKLGDIETDNKVLLRQLQALMPEVRKGGRGGEMKEREREMRERERKRERKRERER